ncbi:MAG TPA: hypothetical protein ENF20_01545 [Candidatus Marinimicrobia bacterium]|nr:hypothetical protein [Candidatus Neomarinimicrobiota bacterium]
MQQKKGILKGKKLMYLGSVLIILGFGLMFLGVASPTILAIFDTAARMKVLLTVVFPIVGIILFLVGWMLYYFDKARKAGSPEQEEKTESDLKGEI